MAAKEKILIADDDRSTVQLLSTYVRRLGLDVLVAYDANQAWMNVVQGAPRAVLLDYKMPAGDGLRVLEKLRQNARTASIPVILMSATNDAALGVRAIDLGADLFLTKPISAEDLTMALSTVLDRVLTPSASVSYMNLPAFTAAR